MFSAATWELARVFEKWGGRTLRHSPTSENLFENDRANSQGPTTRGGLVYLKSIRHESLSTLLSSRQNPPPLKSETLFELDRHAFNKDISLQIELQTLDLVPDARHPSNAQTVLSQRCSERHG